MDFDYIIVGAGSSGSVLAERLTANGKHTVLVLEAGGSDRRFFVQMPLGYGKTFYDPAVNWVFAAEPDPGLNHQRDHWPRGKILGGSSSINAMVYIRGHRSDYDDWEAAAGSDWSFENVLKAYREIEDTEAGGNTYRGVGGPLHIASSEGKTHALTQAYISAAEKTGLKFNPDFNGENQEGVGTYQMTIQNGRRVSTARAFLRPAMKRKNLRVVTSAMVLKILFDGKKAIGVSYRHHGALRDVKCRREVILCGGAINSPQLLQLSGIGPAHVLRQHNISVAFDNSNVGANLQDHQGINYTWRMNVPTMNDELGTWHGKIKAGFQYLMLRSGPLAWSINHGGGFFKTDPHQPRPNMQLYMQPFSTLLPKAGERPLLSPDPFSGLSLGLSNCRPSSRGEITIQSDDPFHHPKIRPNAFSTNSDVSEMLDAVKFLRKIAAQEPLKSLMAEELRPGPSIQSDEDLIADFKQRSGTVYHPSCTCRMGKDAITSVVDSNFKVHGVEALRVVDASAFPNLIAGNTNAPAIMLGWKAGEIIQR